MDLVVLPNQLRLRLIIWAEVVKLKYLGHEWVKGKPFWVNIPIDKIVVYLVLPYVWTTGSLLVRINPPN